MNKNIIHTSTTRMLRVVKLQYDNFYDLPHRINQKLPKAQKGRNTEVFTSSILK